MTYSEITFVKI